MLVWMINVFVYVHLMDEMFISYVDVDVYVMWFTYMDVDADVVMDVNLRMCYMFHIPRITSRIGRAGFLPLNHLHTKMPLYACIFRWISFLDSIPDNNTQSFFVHIYELCQMNLGNKQQVLSESRMCADAQLHSK